MCSEGRRPWLLVTACSHPANVRRERCASGGGARYEAVSCHIISGRWHIGGAYRTASRTSPMNKRMDVQRINSSRSRELSVMLCMEN